MDPPLNPQDPEGYIPKPSHVRRPSQASTDPTSSSTGSSSAKYKPPPNPKPGLRGKMSKMASWLATSEPSAQALKRHKKEAFQKAGVPLHDPGREASSKLHAPVGGIPADAIKATTGPDPEEALKKKKKEAERLRRQAGKSFSSSGRGGSISSGTSLGSSSRKGSASTSTPWEDVPFEGTGWDMLGNGGGN